MFDNRAIRDECCRLISAAAHELGRTEVDLWTATYRRLSAAHQTQYAERAKVRRVRIIELIQMDGKLNDLLAMIAQHYGKAALGNVYRNQRDGKSAQPSGGDDA